KWEMQTQVCAKLEDIGGLKHCPIEVYKEILRELVVIYIGEPSYGQYSSSRPVFYSNGAAPIVTRIIENDSKRAGKYLEELRNERNIKHAISNTAILRRFESLLDLTENE
ncbi:MAG: hypothetical protein ACOC3S_03765, partial [Bacteroidota bacterium]